MKGINGSTGIILLECSGIDGIQIFNDTKSLRSFVGLSWGILDSHSMNILYISWSDDGLLEIEMESTEMYILFYRKIF